MTIMEGILRNDSKRRKEKRKEKEKRNKRGIRRMIPKREKECSRKNANKRIKEMNTRDRRQTDRSKGKGENNYIKQFFFAVNQMN